MRDVPRSDEPDQLELQLQLALGDVQARDDAAAPGTKAAYDRAVELRSRAVNVDQIIRGLYGQFLVTVCRAEFAIAWRIARELFRTSKQHDCHALFVSQQAIGFVLFERGRLRWARSCFEKALEADHRTQGRNNADFANYPSISLSYLSKTLFILGYPDKALSCADQALVKARDASPLTYAKALGNDCYFSEFLRDRHRIAMNIEQLISLVTEKRMPRQVLGDFFSGLLLADQEDFDTGIPMMRQALNFLHRWGDEEEAPYKLALVGDAYRNAGKMTQGLSYITDALAQVGRTGERWYEAELHRSRGLFLSLSVPDQRAAEASFRKAIEIAKRQKAKSWELRAAISLARLWQAKRGGARHMICSAPSTARFPRASTPPT